MKKEGGGTRVLVLTGVPYEDLDLPKLDDLSTGARSEHVQHTLYKGMILPTAALAGLTVLVRRNSKTTITMEETIASHDPKPLGGKIISKPVIIFGPLIVLCMLLIVKRLVFGLGSVSDLNGGFRGASGLPLTC